MREIKFRAWDKTDSEMVGVDLIVFNDKTTTDNAHILDERNDVHYLNEIVLMQYTGLKDKNGKEIYEGDIVRWGLGFTGSWDNESWHRYAVAELFPSLQFRIIYYIIGKTGEKKETDNHVFEFGSFAYKETHKYLEVIGNIYENTELLESKC